MTTSAESLVTEIEHAFANVRPGEIGIRQAEALDGYASAEEQQAARSRDLEIDWRDVPDEVIAKCSATFSFCDPNGWRFYLPAYMRFVLRHRQSDSFDCVLSTLTMGWDASELGQHNRDFVVDESSKDFRLERYRTLSSPQVNAVRNFLNYIAENEDEVYAKDARTAIGIYWERASPC